MAEPKKLSRATRQRITAHHEASVKRALAAEKIANRLLEPEVRHATNELVASVARTPGGAPALRTAALNGITRGTLQLRDSAGRAVVKARSHARALAQHQVFEEVSEAVVAAGQAFEVDSSKLPRLAIAPALDATTQDEAMGMLVGMRIANRWSSVALAGVTIWQRQGGGVDGLVRHIERARDDTSARTNAEAATTAFDAYSDEHRGAMVETLRRAPNALRESPKLDVLTGGGGAGGSDEHFEVGLPLGWGAGIMDIWSAILDRKTCPRCMDVDGTMVPVGKEFPGVGRAPIHSCCRCVHVSVFVPEVFSKRLPGLELDYAALKDDVRDYMRGSTLSLGAGKRHAESYVREVLGQGMTARTSPEVLTRTMLDRDYFPDMPARRAAAPRITP